MFDEFHVDRRRQMVACARPRGADDWQTASAGAHEIYRIKAAEIRLTREMHGAWR